MVYWFGCDQRPEYVGNIYKKRVNRVGNDRNNLE